MQFTFPFQGVLPPGVMSFARWLARLVRRLLVRVEDSRNSICGGE